MVGGRKDLSSSGTKNTASSRRCICWASAHRRTLYRRKRGMRGSVIRIRTTSTTTSANPLLWTYQYPFAWFDFRGRREIRGTKVDWFENCQIATRAHREWCSTELSKQFPGYSADIWGITSSSSPTGYRAWGGPPMQSKVDGSVVPCAAGGSLMLTPDICVPAIHAMKDKYGEKIWGKYGLADAFNPATGWVLPILWAWTWV